VKAELKVAVNQFRNAVYAFAPLTLRTARCMRVFAGAISCASAAAQLIVRIAAKTRTICEHFPSKVDAQGWGSVNCCTDLLKDPVRGFRSALTLEWSDRVRVLGSKVKDWRSSSIPPERQRSPPTAISRKRIPRKRIPRKRKRRPAATAAAVGSGTLLARAEIPEEDG
jgi:hypothetical protein